MKHTSIITALVSKVRIPSIILEDIVNHRTRATRMKQLLSKSEEDAYCKHLDTFITYSIESKIKGKLEIQFSDEWESIETIDVAVAPSFLVTCIKKGDDQYKLGIISSLN